MECVVCLAELEDDEVAQFLPCCNRGFHAQCVDTWLASQSTCPLCQINVVAIARPGMAPVPATATKVERRETRLPASPGGGAHGSPSWSELEGSRGDAARPEVVHPSVGRGV